jgi:large subunit ribosomal protein L1
MGSKKNVDMSAKVDEVKIISDQSVANENTEANPTDGTQTSTKQKTKKVRTRGQKYTMVRSQVDKTKTYDAFAAIELIKKLSYSRFDGTITADVVLRSAGESVTLTFPHSTGKTVRVAIVNDELIAQIESGVIDFDILVTSAQFMPKLARLAKVLGPKGLMPNPKNGTITDKPENKKAELEGGKVTIKSEKKAPLMHVTIGKVSMDTKNLVENLTILTDVLKGRMLRLSLSASMSPSVKVAIQ